MTAIAAVRTKKHIHVGSDTLVTWGAEFARPQPGGKFLELPTEDLIIASSGDARIEMLLGRELRKEEYGHLLHVRHRKDVEDIASHLFEVITELGTGGPKENELINLSMGYILVSRHSPVIWTIESDFGVLEWPDYVAMGSGSNLCEATFYSLGLEGITGRRALKNALKTAVARNPNCGGEIKIRKMRCGG